MKRMLGLVLFVTIAAFPVLAQQPSSNDAPATKEDVEKLIPLKIDRFMIKPVVREKLIEAIEKVTETF